MNIAKNPRVLKSDVYKYIADNSDLSLSQVKECFEVYTELVTNLTFSKYISEDITIALPTLGNFYYRRRKGRKKGSTYIMPIDNSRKGNVRTVVLEEDEPTTYKLSFSVSTTLHRKMKKEWKERLKNNE